MLSRQALAAALVVLPAIAQTPVHAVLGPARGDQLGAAVASLGDVDGDGHDDFAIGAPGTRIAGNRDGRVYVHSGRDGRVLLRLDGAGSVDSFGFSIAAAGDVDGDGRDDVIIGAIGRGHNGTNSGAALVHSGATGALLRAFYGSGPFEVFGWSVAGVGDVDDDGYADVAVGAPGDDVNGPDSGSVSVFSGATGARLHYFAPSAAGDQFGRCVAAAGDVDGDRRPDVLVGAPFADALVLDGGTARVFSGRDGRQLFALSGDSPEEYMGWCVDGVGDLDGDGHGDWIVGAPFDLVGFEPRGSAWVVSGRTGQFLHLWLGLAAYDRLGASVAGCGDVDADGIPDLAVGAPGADGVTSSDVGRTLVLSGRHGTTLYTVTGSLPGDGLGSALAGGGDANADGHAEVVIGAGLADGIALDSGSVAVYSLANPRPNAPRVRIYGAACPSSRGSLPQIEVLGRPVRGATIDLRLRAAPPGTIAALNLDQMPIVYDLTAVGAPSCTLLAAGGTGAGGFIGPTGALSRRMRIPADSSLVGTSLHAQWLIVDAVANALGVITSNAAEIFPGLP